LKHEVFGKARTVARHSLIQHFGGDSIQYCEIGIEQYTLAANHQYLSFDVLEWSRHRPIRGFLRHILFL